MPSSLRTVISAGPIVLAPGAYDGLTARLVAQHGFPAVSMTGRVGADDWDRLRERYATVEIGSPPGGRA